MVKQYICGCQSVDVIMLMPLCWCPLWISLCWCQSIQVNKLISLFWYHSIQVNKLISLYWYQSENFTLLMSLCWCLFIDVTLLKSICWCNYITNNICEWATVAILVWRMTDTSKDMTKTIWTFLSELPTWSLQTCCTLSAGSANNWVIWVTSNFVQ